VHAAPAVSCAKVHKKTHTSIQVQRRQSGIPRAMVLRLISCSPRRPGFLATVACGVASANLTPASGRQDHTTSPSASAPFVIGASASTASRLASVTIANRPSVRRDGEGYRSDLGLRKTRIFFQKGLDRQNRGRPADLPDRLMTCSVTGMLVSNSTFTIRSVASPDRPNRQLSACPKVRTRRLDLCYAVSRESHRSPHGSAPRETASLVSTIHPARGAGYRRHQSISASSVTPQLGT
jgi:hypothetical protein